MTLSRHNRWILVLLLALGVPWYWLLVQCSGGDARPRAITIEHLRTLATGDGGELPYSIRYEPVARLDRSGNMVVAGSGFRDRVLYVNSYLVQYASAGPVMIGSGIGPARAGTDTFAGYGAGAQNRVAHALDSAAGFVPLDADPAQTGGLLSMDRSPQKRLLLAGIVRLGKTASPVAIAPGIVVIPTDSWRPNSRMVYARLGDGREYLFTGMLAPIEENWSKIRAPARLFTDWYRDDNRAEIFSWLMTVNRLHRQAPGLFIVAGAQLKRDSGILRHFPAPGHM